MQESGARRLPRGRHALPRAEVQRIQRSRLCRAMADVMAEKGYVATSVADVLKRAVVSRQSFYELFESKLDCFMAAFEAAGELLLQRIAEAVDDGAGWARDGGPPAEAAGDRLGLFERAITAYLRALSEEMSYARLFLVEVHAAGPEALQRRAGLQDYITQALADLLGVTDEAGRFACHVIVAATSAMVTSAVADNDPDALRALGPRLIAHVRVLWDAGVLAPSTGQPDGA
ncbi:TetR/AcrR family transcriptional regulator [Actinomadura miaoliensis]